MTSSEFEKFISMDTNEWRYFDGIYCFRMVSIKICPDFYHLDRPICFDWFDSMNSSNKHSAYRFFL